MNVSKKIFTLGFFDGVHLGHQALLRQCVTLAKKQNCQPAAITFDHHPQALYLDTPPALISTETDRQLLLRQYGMGSIYTFPVTTEVMSTPWEAFLEQLLEYGAAGFVCGDDFRFGRCGEGNVEKLQAFCLQRNLDLLPTEGRPLSQATKLQDMYRVRKPLYDRFADHHIDNNHSVADTVQSILTLWEENP